MPAARHRVSVDPLSLPDPVGQVGEALRVLTRKFVRGPDLATVIAGVSLVEGTLRRCVRRRLVRGKASDRLTADRGPLGETATLADLAVSLGLLPEDVAEDVKTLAAVRDAFAHGPDAVCFSGSAAARLCKRLRWVGTGCETNRDRFRSAVAFCYLFIVSVSLPPPPIDAARSRRHR